MRKFKTSVAIVAAILAILLPLVLLMTLAAALPPQYSNTFVGELDNKFERLTGIEEEKIVVIGGSSVAFGLDSTVLESYTGRPVVNFGLYAALGTKVMLDLSRPGISEGDIVILAPELDAQTMSMFFSAETTLQAMDEDYSMAMHVRGADNKFSMIGSLWRHVGQKMEYMRDGAPNPSGVYNSSSFNEYGDIVYEREKNVMELYYDPNTIIDLSENILDGEFIDYVNEYIRYCERRGATVYFSYCPMNKLALAPGTTDESIARFEKILSEKINCKFISYIDDYILEPGYFYDTNFHLNDVGAQYRSIKLSEDLLRELNVTTLVEALPEEPELEKNMILVEAIDENDAYFTYRELDNGNYEISGLTELGKSARTLTVPKYARLDKTGYSIGVTSIGEGAFDGASAEAVIISADTNVRQIMNGAFKNASSVKRLDIYMAAAERLLPPTDNFVGASVGFEVHTPDSSNYISDYNWSETVKTVPIIQDLKEE